MRRETGVRGNHGIHGMTRKTKESGQRSVDSKQLSTRSRSGFKFQISSFRFLPAGFTLIELLVVIAIIALLAGILVPVISGAITKGEATTARSAVMAIARAMEAYQQEYSQFPGQTATTTDHPYTGTEYPQVIGALRGSNFMWSAQNSNPRNIVFLDVSDKSIVTNSPGGGTYAAKRGDLADPWGNRYNIVADWNFDNKLSSPAQADGQDVFGRSVAVWSWGPKDTAGSRAGDPSHIWSWK